MEIRKAVPADLQAVGEIAHTTMTAVYPHYYPQGIVAFFLKWNREEKILQDIQADRVYLLEDTKGRAVGTVTLHNAEIHRLFVLPEHQGKGYGRILLDFAEKAVGQRHGKIVLDSSLPGKAVYLKRGYKVIEYKTERMENGDVLCWDVMEKIWDRPDKGE